MLLAAYSAPPVRQARPQRLRELRREESRLGVERSGERLARDHGRHRCQLRAPRARLGRWRDRQTPAAQRGELGRGGAQHAGRTVLRVAESGGRVHQPDVGRAVARHPLVDGLGWSAVRRSARSTSGRSAAAVSGSRSSRSRRGPMQRLRAPCPLAGPRQDPRSPASRARAASVAAASASDASQASGPNTSTPRCDAAARARRAVGVTSLERATARSSPTPARIGRAHLHGDRRRHQRFAERQVQVHRPGAAPVASPTARRASARA